MSETWRGRRWAGLRAESIRGRILTALGNGSELVALVAALLVLCAAHTAIVVWVLWTFGARR